MTHPVEMVRLFEAAASEPEALLALEEGLDALHEGVRILRASRDAKQRLAACSSEELRAALVLRHHTRPVDTRQVDAP